MKKIISVFQRNYDGDRLIRDEVVPGAEWVLAGEGIATRKFDGTCCMIRDGKLYKRYEIKPGGKPPPNFEPANDVDGATGKQQGWLPVGDGPDDKWHRQAWAQGHAVVSTDLIPMGLGDVPFENGTYELVGPKVQGNPEGVESHWLILHGEHHLPSAPRTFDGIREFLKVSAIEGIVFHHPDGRMAKVKTKDYGTKRVKAASNV